MLIKTDANDAVINYLKRDLLVNLNIIGLIENVRGVEIYVDDVNNPNGVLVKKDDYMHYLYTKEDWFIDIVIDDYIKDDFYGFSGVERSIAKKIKNRYDLHWESPCTLYYMPEENLDKNLIKNKPENINVEDAQVIDNNYEYSGTGSLERIKNDILDRPSSAIYADGEIVCWVLVHEDNSVGIMYTKEEHRRKGYAVDVTIDLVSKIIDSGKVPYIQIVDGNDKSTKLAKKCGFVECGKSDWFGIIAGTPKSLVKMNNDNKKQFINSLDKEIRSYFINENEEHDHMYIHPNNFKKHKDYLEELKLVEVKEDSLDTWCNIVIDSYNIKDESVKELFKQSIIKNKNYILYMGKLNNTFVSACLVLRHNSDDETGGIYLLSTLDDYRNKYIAISTLSKILDKVKEKGIYLNLVQSPNKYSKSLKNIGFKKTH